MKIKVLLLCCMFICSITAVAPAALIIDNSTAGYYNDKLGVVLDGTSSLFPSADVSSGDPLINSATEPDLSSASAIFGDWLSDPPNLNSNWTGPQSIPSTWAVNSETAIVYEFDAGNGLENVQGLFGVDNGLFVWLDGNYISGELAPGPAIQWEYNFGLPNLSAGTHYLQILREDHGGGTGWAINLSGDEVAAVPEPTSMLLLGMGILGIAGYGRKKLFKK